MLRLCFVLPVACLGVVSACLGAIPFDTVEKDLGLIYRDQPQKLIYEFTNNSDDTLRVLDIEPSCDCTTAQMVPDRVPPHSRGKILVFFDPMGYEGRGRFSEYVRLMTTEVKDLEVMLTFWATVEVGPEPEPRSLNFGKICRGQTDTLELAIHPSPSGRLRVFGAYSDTACILVEQVAGTGGDPEFRVIATNREGCGRLAGLVTVETSDTMRHNIRIPVSVSFIGRIVAEPDIVAFGPTLPGAYVAQSIMLTAREGVKPEFSDIASSIEHLEPQVSRLSDTTCELRLLVKNGAPPGRVSGEITLKPGCPDEPPIDIKVTGYIRSVK